MYASYALLPTYLSTIHIQRVVNITQIKSVIETIYLAFGIIQTLNKNIISMFSLKLALELLEMTAHKCIRSNYVGVRLRPQFIQIRTSRSRSRTRKNAP